MSDSDEEYDPAQVAPTVTCDIAGAMDSASLNTPEVPTVTNSSSFHPPTGDISPSTIATASTTDANTASGAAATTALRNVLSTSELNAGGGLRLQGIKGAVRSLCLNSSATTLCAAGQDGQLCMWDFTVALSYHRLQPTRVLTPFVNRIAGLQPIISIHCACDDGYFVACQDGDCPVLISASGKQLEMCAMGERGMLDVVKCKAHRAPVTCSAPHPTSAPVFFTGSQDGTARQWDASRVTRGSTYAVKHGTGQITDKNIVESVCGLQGTGSGHVFVSGGDDGCVQLWDARVKYRPGGAMSRWDIYGMDSGLTGAASSATGMDDLFSTTHVGGLVELDAVGGAAPMLAVRAGDTIHCLDLRTPKGNVVKRIGGAVRRIPNARDTTPLVAGREPGSFYACTSHRGFRNQTGGHVVQFTCTGGETSPQPTSLWCAGALVKEDVVCVAVDRSRASGSCFAGLDTGDVVVQIGANPQQPIVEWLATRPGNDRHDGHRAPGYKSTRADAFEDEDNEPLF